MLRYFVDTPASLNMFFCHPESDSESSPRSPWTLVPTQSASRLDFPASFGPLAAVSPTSTSNCVPKEECVCVCVCVGGRSGCFLFVFFLP